MSDFKELDAHALFLMPEAGQFSVYEFMQRDLQRMQPEASRAVIKSTIHDAQELVEEAVPRMHDRIGRLVLYSEALATAMHGRPAAQGRRNRRHHGMLLPLEGAMRFWTTRVQQATNSSTHALVSQETEEPNDVASNTEEDDIRKSYAIKNDPKTLQLRKFIETRMTAEGQLFEGMKPMIGDTYTLPLQADQAQELQKKLEASGGNANIDRSCCYMNGDIILGVAASNALFSNDILGEYAASTLVHEIGHAFTMMYTQYKIQGTNDLAFVVAELLAEYARSEAGYMSASYTNERALQSVLNDVTGTDMIGSFIASVRHASPRSVQLQQSLQAYAAKCVRVMGMVPTGLLLGSTPANYRNNNQERFSGHHLSLLELKESSNRYDVLAQYAPPGVRDLFPLPQTFTGQWPAPEL